MVEAFRRELGGISPRESLLLSGVLGLAGLGIVWLVLGQGPRPPAPPPCPTAAGTLVSDPKPGSNVWVVDACGAKHWVESGLRMVLCAYNPLQIVQCDTSGLPTGPNVGDLGCCPGPGSGCPAC
jgi:hypothetical protein